MSFSITPKPKLFPEHFNLLLDADERLALDDLYELDTSLTEPIEIVHEALRAGIKALNQAAQQRGRDPHEPTRTELEAGKRSTARRNEKSPPQKEPSIYPKPHYHVENYIGIPLETRLRIKLEDFLLENQGVMTDEEAFQLLLDLGLRYAAGERPSEVIQRVRKEARRRVIGHQARSV
jgi:hypothetical protein